MAKSLLEINQLLTEIQNNVRRLNPGLVIIRRDLVYQGEFLIGMVQDELKAKIKGNLQSDLPSDTATRGDLSETSDGETENASNAATTGEDHPEQWQLANAKANSSSTLPETEAEETLTEGKAEADDDLEQKKAEEDGTQKKTKEDAKQEDAKQEKTENNDSKEGDQTVVVFEEASSSSQTTANVEISPWPVLITKVEPMTVMQLEGWLGRVSRMQRRLTKNLEIIDHILDLTHELKDKLAHEFLMARTELVPRVIEYEEDFTKLRQIFREDLSAYTAYLETFPENPFLEEPAQISAEQLQHMEEARPFPNPWRQPNGRSARTSSTTGMLQFFFPPN